MTTTESVTIGRVAGVDGCRTGWLVASSEVYPDGAIGRPELHVVTTFDAVFDLALDRIAVDIPIGLLDVLAAGGREADRAARSYSVRCAEHPSSRRLPGRSCSPIHGLHRCLRISASRVRRGQSPERSARLTMHYVLDVIGHQVRP